LKLGNVAYILFDYVHNFTNIKNQFKIIKIKKINLLQTPNLNDPKMHLTKFLLFKIGEYLF